MHSMPMFGQTKDDDYRWLKIKSINYILKQTKVIL